MHTRPRCSVIKNIVCKAFRDLVIIIVRCNGDRRNSYTGIASGLSVRRIRCFFDTDNVNWLDKTYDFYENMNGRIWTVLMPPFYRLAFQSTAGIPM